jgi:hypothetical protein
MSKIEDGPVYFRCSCRSPHHALVFERDEDVPTAVNVTFMSARNASFWHRVKWSLKHIFGGESLVFADLVFEPDDAKRLGRFIDHALTQEKG